MKSKFLAVLFSVVAASFTVCITLHDGNVQVGKAGSELVEPCEPTPEVLPLRGPVIGGGEGGGGGTGGN